MNDGGAKRNAQIRIILDDELRRAASGEQVSLATLIAAHPELMPELADGLRELELSAAVDKRAAQTIESDFATRSHTDSNSASGSGYLAVRCPNCHMSSNVAVDTELTELTCSSCGSHFSLVGKSTATHTAPALSKLGRFDLVERLGVGAFGTVWKARDKQLDRTVALKIPRAGDMTVEEQEKFFREARAAAQLKHPNIVSVHEVGRDGDSIYIVSDFVSGVTMGDFIEARKLTSDEAAKLCARIAVALDHAHEQGVVHRDLKPANIMIDGDGEPHLMDFGLARRDMGEVTVTMDGQILGTPAYMAPEQAEGDGHTADRRSDVYSLGVILFQLLTGELPFRGNARMVMYQTIHDEPPSPRKLNASIKKDLETITLKCLEKQRSRRYATAKLLADDLRHFLVGKPVSARPVSRVERAWRWAKREPMMAACIAFVSLLAIVGPLVAVRESRLRILIEERYNLIKQQDHDTSFAASKIADLTRKLDVWEGRANPWDFWPPKQDDSLRQNIITDLANHSNATLAKSLEAGKFSDEDSARGFYGIAIIAEALGRTDEARLNYQKAQEKLASLYNQHSQQEQYVKGLAECQVSVARLAEGDAKQEATKQLEQARSAYQQLAGEHRDDPSIQVDWLESEWASAKMNGFEAGQPQLARVAKIKSTISNSWPSEPNAFYRFACYLTRREPILAQPLPVDETKR